MFGFLLEKEPVYFMQMTNHSTIAAIATPQGGGGIGIVRVSGPAAAEIGSRIFSRSGALCSGVRPSHEALLNSASLLSGESNGGYGFKSHRMYHGFIKNPEKGTILDEVLLVYMKGPHSYTAEDVIEIQAHSSPLVLQSILELVLWQGARLAEPGEFTKRAYLNGRIDLTQAEAVIDIINARTTASLNIALSQIRGNLKTEIECARQILVELFSHIEAVIDFPDEVSEIIDPEKTLKEIEHSVFHPLQQLVKNYKDAHFLRDGFKLMIVGAPNVGKSSLMNRLINKERSIVTSIPGTTRDLIEDTFNLNGIPFVLTDTAGFHETDDPVESIGIQKARHHLDQSDLILFMADASLGIRSEELSIFEDLRHKKIILVLNKMDLAKQKDDIKLPICMQAIPQTGISALVNEGIDDLKDMIVHLIIGDLSDHQHTIIPNLRHKVALEHALTAIESLMNSLRSSQPQYELNAIDIREAIDHLDEILGSSIKLDVLENIFQNFCIGK